MLTLEELRVLDDWRFGARMPSRAAAIRELLKRGLAAEGFDIASTGVRSGDYGVTDEGADAKPGPDGLGAADGQYKAGTDGDGDVGPHEA